MKAKIDELRGSGVVIEGRGVPIWTQIHEHVRVPLGEWIMNMVWDVVDDEVEEYLK